MGTPWGTLGRALGGLEALGAAFGEPRSPEGPLMEPQAFKMEPLGVTLGAKMAAASCPGPRRDRAGFIINSA